MLIALAVWSAIALGVCVTGGVEWRWHGLPVALLVFYSMPIAVTVALFRASPSLRDWMLGLDMRLVMLLHTARAGGFCMLVAAGRIAAPAWSVSGGLGDCTSAIALGTLAAVGFSRGRLSRRQVVFWNLFGIADALHVGTLALLYLPGATGLLAGNTPATDASLVLTFPFNLITTLFIPILFSAHLIVLEQARRRPATIEFA